MKTSRLSGSRSAFSLVELLIAIVILVIVGIMVTSFTVTETWLFAKNTALNNSHRSARRALDRLANELQQTQSLPTLIDETGTPTAAATAAGLSYDRLVGAPYKIEDPGGAGFKAKDTKITITRSTDPLASPPLPLFGDVLLMDLPTGNPLRAQVASVKITKTDAKNNLQTMDLTLVNQLGIDIPFDSAQVKAVQIVRRQAFIVVPNGAHNELRYYQNFEPMPVLNDPAQYVMVTPDISTVKLPDGTRRDVTPFSIDTSTGDKLVKASLRMQAREYVYSLASKQANSFNTFVQIDVTLPSRLRPKS
ncbi:MAG: hypothetical protein ABI674_08320 [Spartobacteria bacterium]